MLTFYADDSGKTRDHEYLVVAAYVGLAAQWETFAIDWRLRLAKAGLTWFHASDFFHGTDEFGGWNTKQRAGERKMLLMDLVEIIGKATLQSFLCHVHVRAYERLNSEFMLRERFVTPFSLCARTIVGQARNWWRERGGDYKNIRYVFDRGCEDWGLLMKRLETDHGVIPIPERKREVRPIQASDWFAWESFQQIPFEEHAVPRVPRESFLALLNVSKAQPTIYRENDLRKLCEDRRANIPKRDQTGG